MGDFAWVTLATNDSYSLGALVLAHSLRRVGTKHDLAVLVTPGVTGAMREKLSSVFSLVQEVNVLDSKDQANLALLARPELGITFTKLHCWRLTQYQKCVFVDADTLVIRNCDELFEREELSAAPDVGWPDCFNSGVFVFKPSQQTFASITSFAAAKGSFDGGDQGLLNQYFSDWAHKDISKHLPFIYNMCSTATYSYLPAFKQFGDDVRIIHFIGITKPWLQYFDTLTGQVQPAPGSNHLQPLLQLWWNIFCENVHPQLSPVMASSTLAPLWHEFTPRPTFSEGSTNFPTFVEDTSNPDFSEFKDPWENYERQTDVYASEPRDSRVNYDHEDNRSKNNKPEVVCKIDSFQYSAIQDDYLTEQNSSPFHFTENKNPTDDYKISSVLEISRKEEARENSQFHDPIEDRRSSTVENHYFCNFHEKEANDRSNNFNESETCLSKENFSSHEINNLNEMNNEWKKIAYDDIHRRNDEINEKNCYSENENFPIDEKISCQDFSNDKEFSSFEENRSVLEKNCEIDENRLHDKFEIESRVKQTETHDENSQSHPEPCTKSKCVTTQSESKIARQPNSNDAGIAGALAKITLGEARSPEQVAFEEHMRKQSWEQGQIDYMGRDSFDNIWKKISETLAIQPERETSPPKTTPKVTTKNETAVATTPAIEDKPAAKSEAAVLAEPRQRDEQDPIVELAIEIEKLIPSLSEVTKREIVETQSTGSETAVSSQSDDFRSIPTTTKDSSIPRVSQSVEVDEKFQGKPETLVKLEKSVEKEITRTPEVAGVESPVPIQVAESVLEADVKESVTEDLRPVREEAISTISLTAQESVPAVSESVMEAVEPPISTPNGSVTLSSEIGNGIDALTISSPVRITTAIVESRSLQNVEPPRTEEPLPVVVAAQASRETLPTSQIQEFCSLPLREPRGTQIVEEIQVTGKSEEAPLPVDRSVSTLPAASEKSQETKLPTEIKIGEQKSPDLQEVSKTLGELTKNLEKSEISTELPVKSTETQQLSVESIEKFQEPKISPETREISQTLSEPVEKSEKLPEQVQSSSAQALEESEETKLPAKSAEPSVLVKTEKSNLPTFESSEKPELVASQEKKVEQVSCPVKPARKIEIPELTIKTEKSVLPSEKEETVEIETEEIASQSESSEESPVRPSRTKETQIPSTPTITEATPPTSPPIGPIEPLDPQQATKSTKKVVKKIVKKTTETDSEPEGKKVTKKLVKKVVKKKEDDVSAEGTSGNEKPKKIVKVVKKTTKTSSSLEAETTVPETPPPGTSEIPVPPKRKSKTNAKTTKSDSEP